LGNGRPQSVFSAASASGLGAGRLVKEIQPIGDRILFRRDRQLVDKAFGHEHIVRRADAAPKRGRNSRRFNP
jgi:hypothetical protein